MSEIKPALTAHEWRNVLRGGDSGWSTEQDIGIEAIRRVTPQARHAIAAFALHGQPFGFTRRDIEILRRCETILSDYEEHDEEAEAHVQLLADRIEALLPPE